MYLVLNMKLILKQEIFPYQKQKLFKKLPQSVFMTKGQYMTIGHILMQELHY